MATETSINSAPPVTLEQCLLVITDGLVAQARHQGISITRQSALNKNQREILKDLSKHNKELGEFLTTMSHVQIWTSVATGVLIALPLVGQALKLITDGVDLVLQTLSRIIPNLINVIIGITMGITVTKKGDIESFTVKEKDVIEIFSSMGKNLDEVMKEMGSSQLDSGRACGTVLKKWAESLSGGDRA